MTSMDTNTFSILDAVKHRTYPEDSVTIYTDAKAAYDYERLEAELNDYAQYDATLADLEKQVAAAKEAVRKSALTFHMRGFAAAVYKNIEASVRAQFLMDLNEPLVDGSQASVWVNYRCVAESILRVENADGDVDEHKFTPEEVGELFDYLPASEADKLFVLAHAMSFRAFSYDAAVTPDFS